MKVEEELGSQKGRGGVSGRLARFGGLTRETGWGAEHRGGSSARNTVQDAELLDSLPPLLSLLPARCGGREPENNP